MTDLDEARRLLKAAERASVNVNLNHDDRLRTAKINIELAEAWIKINDSDRRLR